MDFNRCPADILWQIIRRCDVLTVLRLERVSKRIRNLINIGYWRIKYHRAFPYLKNFSSDCKATAILMSLTELRTELIWKYWQQILAAAKEIYPDANYRYYRGTRGRIKIRELRYQYLCRHFSDDPLLREMRLLKKNLWQWRSSHPIEKRQVAIYQHDRIKFPQQAGSAQNESIYLNEYYKDGYFHSLNIFVPTNNRWKSCSSVRRYLFRLKIKYCLSSQEFKDLFQGNKEVLNWLNFQIRQLEERYEKEYM